MSTHRWTDHRVCNVGNRPLDSRRERAANRRRRRAQAHLERVRRGPRTARMPFHRVPVAWLAALGIGAWVAAPIATAARGWLAVDSIQIRTISVRGASHLTADRVAEATGVQRGAPLSQVDPDAVEAKLVEHPWIDAAKALRLPTGRLLVRISERVPLASVALGDAGARFAVDASGTPFAELAEAELTGLPRLAPANAIEPGQSDEGLAEAVRLTRRMRELALPTPDQLSIAADSDAEGFAVRLPGLAPRVVLGRAELDDRLAALARLLEADLPEVNGSERLDLRFAQQAVLHGAPPPQGAAKAAATRGGGAPSKARPTG